MPWVDSRPNLSIESTGMNEENRMEIAPYDLTGYYLSASMGLGQRLRLDTIDQRLGRYPLRRVLALLAQIAFRADHAIRNKEKRLKLARALFPAPVVSRAIERLEGDDAREES